MNIKPPKGFSEDYPLSEEERNILKMLEWHPEVVSDIQDWDNLCTLMEITNGTKVSHKRHKLIATYEKVLERRDLL